MSHHPVQTKLSRGLYLLLGALALSLSASLRAQPHGNDLICMKSGAKHQGSIVEQKPGAWLRLASPDAADTIADEDNSGFIVW